MREVQEKKYFQMLNQTKYKLIKSQERKNQERKEAKAKIKKINKNYLYVNFIIFHYIYIISLII